MLNANLCIQVLVVLGASTVNGAEPRDIGHICTEAGYGNLTDKYEPQSDRDIKLGQVARYFIDNSRIFFKTGIGKIPPLDPLKVAYPEPAKFNDKEITGTITLSDFILEGVQQFKFEVLEIRLNSGRVDFSVDVPKLYVDVNYKGDVKVDESDNYFDGHANVSFYNVNISGAFSLAPKPANVSPLKQKLQVVGLYYNVSSDDIQYNLKNLEESKSAVPSRRVKRAAESSDIIKTVVREVSKVASQSAALSLIDIVNEILLDYSAEHILNLINSYIV